MTRSYPIFVLTGFDAAGPTKGADRASSLAYPAAVLCGDHLNRCVLRGTTLRKAAFGGSSR